MDCRGVFFRRVRRARVFLGVPLCAAVCAVAVTVTSSPAAAVPTSSSRVSAADGQRPVASVALKIPRPVAPGGGSGAAALRYVPKPVREIVADRTAMTSTWQDADGALTVRRYLAPHFYQSASSGWLPINPALAPAAGQPGWWRSRANSWTASFGPAGAAAGAEQLSVAGGQIGFAPLRVSDPAQEPQVSGPTATYKGLWPDVDLREQVTASGVDEAIVLNGPGSGSSFQFRVQGATAQANAAGGVDLLAGGRRVGVIPALTVEAKLPRPARPGLRRAVPPDLTKASGARISVSGGVVQVSVSPRWLAGLPASAFPVVIDPTFSGPSAQTQLVSVSNTGSTLTGVMQNGLDSSGQTWRSAAYIPMPTLPAPSNNNPWQLEAASFQAACASSCGQPGVGLTGLGVYGEATPQSTDPTFAGIPDGTPIWVNPPNSGWEVIGTDMTTFFRGRTGAWIGVVTNEAGFGYGTLVTFDPSQVYAYFVYVEQPRPTTITSPASESVLSTLTPTLTAAPAAGESSAFYDFKISTNEDGTGIVIDSGWLNNQTSWTVPPGSLRDGVLYWATILDAISQQWDPSAPSYVPPAYPNPPISFEIKQRLGAGGPSPTDTVGSPPQGTTTPSQGAPSPGAPTASETVNMVTGNLAVAVGTPSMQALGGPAGITLTYNSASSSVSTGGNYGVTGQYYPDSGNHQFTGALVGQRTDPGVDETWSTQSSLIGGLAADAPFLVRWTGVLSLPGSPNDTWELGGLTSGGMQVFINGSGTAAFNDWAGTGSPAVPSYGTQTFSGGRAYQVEVDDWENYQEAGQPVVQLWAKDTAITDPSVPNAFVVPSGWLSPAATGVPAGWSMLANAATVQWIHAYDEGTQVVLQSAAGQTATFIRTVPEVNQAPPGGMYQAPPGDTDYLNVDGSGHLQLSTSDNYLYTFNPDGSLASMTSIVDDRHPAALQYSYSGTPALLRTITDPVSGRAVTLSYGGDSSCPSASQAPPAMLCQVSYWDGSTAVFGYTTSNGVAEIASVTDSGGQVMQFGYDSSNQLADIRDALASDYLTSGGQAGTAASCASGTAGLAVVPVDTQICYDSSGRVAAITQPAPTPGAGRPGRTYTYTTGHTDMSIAGFSPASGYAERVVYDAQDRITQQLDSAGRATTTVWATGTAPNAQCRLCGQDEPIVSVNPAGEQTSSVYDTEGNVTDVYGPAPAACFSGGWPSDVTPPSNVRGYLPVSNPQGTSGCGVAVPRTSKTYDAGLNGLATTYWTNGQLAGAAALHATGTPGSPGSSFCGATSGACGQWQAGSAPVSTGNGQWSLRLTGTIDLPYTGGYDFAVAATQSTTLSIDGLQILYDGPGDYNFVPGQLDVQSVSEYNGDGLGFGAGLHQIEVDFHGSTAQLSEFDVRWASVYQPPGQSIPAEDIPSSVLDPGYDLLTSTTDPDGKYTTNTYSDPSHHIGPEYGLVTSTSSDPAGLNLTTTTTYEDPTQGGYLRKLATTLPAGNTTSDAYYSGTAGPVAAACGVSASTPQGGQLEQQTGPPPGGSGQSRVVQFIYDTIGRPVGERIGTPADIGSAAWQCTSYDARGRITSQSWPSTGSGSARTVTYTYSVGGNPLASSVSDASGTITSSVDLLGRVTNYTDVYNKGTGVTYNQAGQITGTSGAGGVYSYGYDPNSGQPTTTSVNGTLLATSSYDTAGRLAGVGYGNGTTAAIGYDPYGLQDSLTYTATGGQVITTDSVTHSAGGRVSTETASQPGGSTATVSYCYDGTGRLTGIAGSAGCSGTSTSSYSYNPNPASDNCAADGGSRSQGANTNRTSVSIPSGTTDYCYNTADQLVATITGGVTSTSYAYNEHGDMTNDNGTQYSWDASDRPISEIPPSGNTIFETYDPVSRLIRSANVNSTVRYSYAGYSDTPDAVLDDSNNVLQELVALPGGVGVTLQSAGNVWSYSNLQGDTIATGNSAGVRTAGPVTYDPWGNLTPGQAAPANTTGPNTRGAYAASGKLTDTTTGTILLGARLFSPTEARFLTVDPIEGGCANAYTYAFGDPVNGGDLTGQASDCEKHHIVPQKLNTGGLGAVARGILQSVGISINDLSNLVLISTSGHRTGGVGNRVHGTNAENLAYLQWVVANLKAAPQTKAGIRAALTGMAAQLQAAFPCGGNGGGGFDWTPVIVGVAVVGVGLLTAGIGDLLGGLAGGILGLA